MGTAIVASSGMYAVGFGYKILDFGHTDQVQIL